MLLQLGTHTLSLCACLQIQEALKNDMARFQFEGREVKLDPRAGIFITMVRFTSGTYAPRASQLCLPGGCGLPCLR